MGVSKEIFEIENWMIKVVINMSTCPVINELPLRDIDDKLCVELCIQLCSSLCSKGHGGLW